MVELAAHHRMPGMYPYRLVVDAGGLMAYDSYTSELQARAAAMTLGLTILQALLRQADELIQ